MLLTEYKEVDGIKVFHDHIDKNHEDYNAKWLDQLYLQEEKHFWFLARKDFILQNFRKYIPSNAQIIEIGAGTGNVSRKLQQNGYQNISVGEMHSNGLKYAKGYGITNCYQFDLLNSPFQSEFDVVGMFDVLEHIEEDVRAIQNVGKMLNRNGCIVLSVPSHMWLWNRGDTIAGHKRRYTKKELVKKLEENGFEIITAKYFLMIITPLLFLRKILNKDRGNTLNKEELNQQISTNPIVSKALFFLLNIENKLHKFLPNFFGGSLFVIARKIDK